MVGLRPRLSVYPEIVPKGTGRLIDCLQLHGSGWYLSATQTIGLYKYSDYHPISIENIVYLVTHETLHWVLDAFISWEACWRMDLLAVKYRKERVF
jgi:hypothetical protein